MARTFALVASVWRILRQVLCSSETVSNAPKRKETHQTWVQGPMVWIGSIRCETFRHDFVARTFALIAPVWRVLQQVSCSRETVPNAPKQNETHQNMSLGSNAVDREHTLRKILTRLRGTNFCINCTSLAHFAPSFVQKRNGPKCTQTERNSAKHELRVQWCGSWAFIVINYDTTSCHELLH